MRADDRSKIEGTILTFLLLILGLAVVTYAFVKYGYLVGSVIAVLPLLAAFIVIGIKRPVWVFIFLLVVNYFIPVFMRRLPDAPLSLVLDSIMLFNVVAVLIMSYHKKVEWKRAINGFTITIMIWMLYCMMELFNPQSVSFIAGLSATRTYFIYPLVIAIIVALSCENYKDLFLIFNVWAVLTIISAIKAMIQKYIGFTPVEAEWVYTVGKTTHIIWSGIRYFSIFTDAASFGSAMSLALVVFSISAIYVKSKFQKIFFIITAFFALYGMLISGTRSSLVIPLVGYTAFTVLTKNAKLAVVTVLGVLFLIVFLKFSNIGQGNSVIRRARSVFDTNDPSNLARRSNQKLIGAYMADKPFGVGMGLGGGKAKVYAPYAYASQIPTDSWFVMMWVEVGIIGLILRLLFYLYVVGYGAYIVLFKLQNKELRCITASLTVGLLGLFVNLYANEVLQFPNITTFYMIQALIFLAPFFDKEITESQKSVAQSESLTK